MMDSFKKTLKKIINVKDEEISTLLYSFAYFFFLLSSYYILRPLRDEMGIRGGIENLQWLFTGTFMAILLVVPIFAYLVSKFPRQKFLPWTYRFFILNIVVFWALFKFGQNVQWTARVFFIWTSVFNLFVVSIFWSFMADIFSKNQASRLFGFIAAGGTCGAILGPLLTMGLVKYLGTTNILILSALLLEFAVQCIDKIIKVPTAIFPDEPASPEKTAPLGGGAFSGIKIVFNSPYLLLICLFIFLHTTCATFLYFAQAQIVSAAFVLSENRTALFAKIDFLVNTLTLLFQIFLTQRFLKRFGLTAALVFVPAVCVLGFIGINILPAVLILVIFQVLRRSANYALTKPAREILFTVLNREEKYKSKNFIDTVVYRGGDALSAWAFAALKATGRSLQSMMLIATILATVWLSVSLVLGRKYHSVKNS